MLFDSPAFLIFMPIALLGHALLRGAALRFWLVVMSYVFYGWANPVYCFLLLASTVLDFNVGPRLADARSARARKAWLAASLIGNLGLLATFKYLGFVAETLNAIAGLVGLGIRCPDPHILLPIGISFYTFQTLSYTIDIYRGRMTPTRSFTTFALYVAFFPQLVAGPIERATHLLHQLADKQPRDQSDVLVGMTRISWGLMKKVIFADWLGGFVSLAYDDLGSATSADLLLATYAFAFQIYLDFSAYSDIAIGLARTMGVELRENFRWPYLSRNVSEFWRRWHISLSTWLRDYLYISLGGSRKGPGRTALNLVIVMFLGGLWHGADNKFIAWGVWLGGALAVFHAWATWLPRKQDDAPPFRWRQIPSILLTFHVVLISWVFFRANSMSDALEVFSRFVSLAADWTFALPNEDVWRTTGLLLVASAAHVVRGLGLHRKVCSIRSPIAIGVSWGVMIVAMLLFRPSAGERFIYFQF